MVRRWKPALREDRPITAILEGGRGEVTDPVESVLTGAADAYRLRAAPSSTAGWCGPLQLQHADAGALKKARQLQTNESRRGHALKL